jgi:lipoprotein-anchoring transpeptidase ErfK/SrfK
MGLADLPRAYFRGFTYWNPSTMNNNDYQPTYDPATATLTWPWLERHGVDAQQDFDRFATRSSVLPLGNDVVNAVTPDKPPALWNFYGDNSCGFVRPDEPLIEWPSKFSKPPDETKVIGYTNTAGNRIDAGDPWIGLPVVLNAGIKPAKLVDVDPVCPWSSQIFVDSFRLGNDTEAPGFAGATAGRAHARWVFLKRNISKDLIIAGGMSAMWQIALPAEGLNFEGPAPVPGSLAAEFKATLKQSHVRGMMVRFVTYHTLYFQGDAFPSGQDDWSIITALYAEYASELARYERGERTSPPPRPVNRAYSNVVGWIAPWTTTDMRSAPVGRILHAGNPVPAVNIADAQSIGPASLEFQVDAMNPDRVSRVSIDLGTAIPEYNAALDKLDFGTMQLALAPPGGTPKPFAEVPYAGGYDKTAYEAGSGVVDIPASRFLAPVSARDMAHHIVVRFVNPADGTTQVGLEEADYTAETDDRGVYVNEPGAPWSPPDPTLDVEVRFRGGPPPAGTRLQIAQYAPDEPGFNESGWELVSDSAPQAQTPYTTLDAGGSVIDGAYVTVAVPDSTVTIRVSGLRSGPPVLRFAPVKPGDPDPTPPAAISIVGITQGFFANVRVLPFHNAMTAAYENWLRSGPSVDLATQRIFDSVFRTFFLMYPAMRFLSDPLKFQARRGPVCAVTDPALFDSAEYMPVTRALSAGQRRMLELWTTYVDGKVPSSPRRPKIVRRS